MKVADITTHVDLTKQTLGRFQRDLLNGGSIPSVEVAITNGRQSGLKRVLRSGTLVIGSGDQSDVTIMHPGVAAQHTQIELSRSMFGLVASVTANADKVLVNGEHLASGSSVSAVSLPLELSVAGTDLTIGKPASKAFRYEETLQERVESLFSRIDPVLLLTCCALFVLLMGTLLNASSLFGRQTAPILYQEPLQPLNAAVTEQPDSDWLGRLESEATELNLKAQLNMSYIAVDIIRVTGTVTDTELRNLRNLQAWYDSQTNAPTVIWDIARRVGLPEMPRIGMIRLSEPSQIVLADGKKVSLGEELSNGWLLESVSQQGLTLARGEERAIVPMQEILP